eukprot:7088208-Prymnesium_polylepis.1
MDSGSLLRQKTMLNARQLVVDSCTRLRYKRHLSDEAITDVKQLVRDLIGLCNERVKERCEARQSQQHVDDLLQLLDPITEAVDSVNSYHKESKQMEASVPLVKPRRRVIGRYQSSETLPDQRVKTVQHEDVVYDMPFEEQLEQVLQYNPE